MLAGRGGALDDNHPVDAVTCQAKEANDYINLVLHTTQILRWLFTPLGQKHPS